MAEAEQFAASLQQSEPLSDEPVEDFPFSFGDNFLDTENLGSPMVRDRMEPKSQPTSTVTPTWKPPKARKSALQEASELPSQKPPSQSKSAKGKKKKGFQ